MRVIALNCWGGKKFDDLAAFVRREAPATDVFCFQEMIFGGPGGPVTSFAIRSRLFEELAEVLSATHAGYEYHAAPEARFFNETLPKGTALGQAMFVKKDIEVVENGSIHLYGDDPFQGELVGLCTGVLQYAVIKHAGVPVTIGNIHGLFLDMRNPSPGKGDTPERLEQSRQLAEFFKGRRGVLVGDFNLRPQTESVAILSQTMRNLIAEYGITSTRNYEYVEMEKWKDYIADYAFTTKDVTVKHFQVLPDVVSDHAPLMVEFDE